MTEDYRFHERFLETASRDTSSADPARVADPRRTQPGRPLVSGCR